MDGTYLRLGDVVERSEFGNWNGHGGDERGLGSTMDRIRSAGAETHGSPLFNRSGM